MTAHRCWLEYPSDRALQARVKRGDFGESLPISSFPPARHGSLWPILLHEWCRLRQLTPVNDGLEVRVRVKKDQVADFIDHVYGEDPSYIDPACMLTWKGHAYLANRLNDLRAFVAQQLRPNLWYDLKADEF